MLIYILGAQISSSFFPEMRWFQQVFLFLNIFKYFLRVENAILEPILEPKNGITGKKLGSKTPLADSILEPKMVPQGV